MKVFIVLGLIASALAFPGLQDKKSLGIAFPEEIDLPQNRIIQGWPAVNGQFPHQAFLIISDNSGSGVACGGSLISTTWVLTAAHCVYQRVSAQVHLGDVAYNSSPVKITTRTVQAHGSYNPNNLNNDLGLIGLGSAVTLTTNIQVIKFPSTTSDLHAGKVSIVSGYGKTSDTGSVSPTLNFVNLTIITNTVCAQTYGTSTIISSTICGVGITSGAQGSCNGDSGGPLILREASGDTLIGVVSFVSSSGCAANLPSGFVRPNFFYSWISGITGI